MEETSIRRTETRFFCAARCEVSHGPYSVSGVMLKDISRSGAMIDYPGAPLPRGEAVMVRIPLGQALITRPATVMWSRVNEGGRAASGLKLLDPVPAISMIVLSKEARDHLFN